MQGAGVDMIEIKIAEKEIENIKSALKGHPEAMERAIIRTRNDVAERGMPKVVSAIRKKYNIKKEDLLNGKQYSSEKSRNLIKFKKTNSINQIPSIEIRGSLLTLVRFAEENKPNKKGVVSKQVKVKVKKGRAKKLSKYTFIQTVKGHNQILARRQGSREIYKLLKTTSVAHMANNKEVQITAMDGKSGINTLLEKRSQHYINQELRKIKGDKK